MRLPSATICVLSSSVEKQNVRTCDAVENLQHPSSVERNSPLLSGKVEASSRLNPGITASAPSPSANPAAIFSSMPLRLGTQTDFAVCKERVWSSIDTAEPVGT